MGGSATPSAGSTAASSTHAMPSPSVSGMTAAAGTSAAPGVTSTGVIRVGLAGQSSPMAAMLFPSLAVAAFVLAFAIGFLIRRRRNSPTSHE